jgi:hypothetical protein
VPTENDLVEEIAVAKWQEQRCWTLITALVDITMDRMEQEIAAEFTHMDNATALPWRSSRKPTRPLGSPC